MSWFSKLAGAVGSGVKDVGHFVGKVASNPLVDAGLSFIPGVGPVAAGAAAGLGRLMAPGGNIGNAIGSGLKGGLEQYGMGKLAALAHPGGVAGNTDVPGDGADASGGNGAPADTSLMGRVRAAGGDLVNSMENSAKNYMTDGGKGFDWKKLIGLGGLAAGAYSDYKAGQDNSKYLNSQLAMRNNELNMANNDYAQRAPMRNAAFSTMQGMLQRGPTADVVNPYLRAERDQQPAGAGMATQPGMVQGDMNGASQGGLLHGLAKLARVNGMQPKQQQPNSSSPQAIQNPQ